MSLLSGSGYQPLPDVHVDYADLAALERNLLSAVKGKELFEEKLRSFFRSAIDEVIDTAHPSRYFLSDLEKTEKTYLGTKFEILLRDWLQVPKGVVLDLLIGGREVDVKSTTGGKSGWSGRGNNICVSARTGTRRLASLLVAHATSGG